MIVVIARAKKDAKALKHAIARDVLSLGGVRSLENFDFSTFKYKVPLFFFGREDENLAEEVEREVSKLTPVYKVIRLKKKSVRNARMSELIEAFELAKAELRLGFTFKNNCFSFTNTLELVKDIRPDYDAYFLFGKGFVENTKRIFGIDVKEGNLILRGLLNEEKIYVPELKAVISKKIGSPPCLKFHEPEVKPREVKLKNLIEQNRYWLKKWEEVAVSFIRNEAKGEVGVPLSGGKDSAAALILAKKALGKVKALYVKVSHEVPFTEEYVEYLCNTLEVELVKREVRFDVEKYGLPTHENRWCTELKVKALKEIATDTLIVGDRDAESRVRRRRNEVEKRVALELFPLKYWSGAMVQLYVLMHGIKLHPLYYEGFYRLGCTICPSLSHWEKLILEKVYEKNFLAL